MDLTRGEAIRLFHEQWSDMRKELGNKPDSKARNVYKWRWCNTHEMHAVHSCYLCDYVRQAMAEKGIERVSLCCSLCPIVWPTYDGTCYDNRLSDGSIIMGDYFLTAPIDEILALPERGGGEQDDSDYCPDCGMKMRGTVTEGEQE